MQVLFIKTSALGDIVQSFAAIEPLLQICPEAKIDWAVEKNNAPLVAAHPSIRHVFEVETKKWRSLFWQKPVRQEISSFYQSLRQTHYDWIFDLQGNIKSGLLLALAAGKQKVGFGWKSAAEWPNCLFSHQKFNPPPNQNIRDDYRYLVQQALLQESAFANSPSNFSANSSLIFPLDNLEKELLAPLVKEKKEKNSPPRFLVCPGTKWENKQLSPQCLMGFLMKIEAATSCQFYFAFGSESEEALVKQIQSSFVQSSSFGYLSFPMLQNLMSHMDLVISMDSFPLHLAATTKAATYSIFGPSLSQKYAPQGERHHAFQGSCPYGKTFSKRCPLLRRCPTGSCIKDLSPDQLLADFLPFWQKLKK